MFTATALLDGAPIDDAIALFDLAVGLDPLAKECPEDVPCRIADQDLWFADTPTDLELAKELCAGCPARLACLAGAVDRREPWGVWGGELFERGVIVARKRPRGRPRKDAVADDSGMSAAADEVAA
ncbi:MAG TPA: WhiB family transcriptional regulator [Jatrophihabitans sp.]